jgi:hypothetical protein
MRELPNLVAKKELEEFVFHLNGILELSEVVGAQIEILDESIDTDLEQATDALGRLRAELYTHLPYHLKELRRPFLEIYNRLGQNLDGRFVGDNEMEQ